MLLIVHHSGPNAGTSQVVSIDPGLHELEQRRELTKRIFELVELGVQWSVNLDLATDAELAAWSEIEDKLGLLDLSEEIRNSIEFDDELDDVEIVIDE